MRRAIYLSLLLIFTLSFISAVKLYGQRQVSSFNLGWKFHLGDACNIERDFGYGSAIQLQFAKQEPAPYGSHGISATLLDFDDSSWQDVTTPHDWSVDLPYDFGQDELSGSRYGYRALGRVYPKNSIGWYRKSFFVPSNSEGKRVTLEFDGVFRNSQLWINGFYVKHHWSGHTGFVVDISDYLKHGEENVVSLRVDASLHEGWFGEGAGINKDVRIITTDNLHISQNGAQITTSISSGSARVKVANRVCNSSSDGAVVQVDYMIVDSQGRQIAHQLGSVFNIEEYSSVVDSIELEIDGVKLWSPDTPYRYTLEAKLICCDRVVDNVDMRFGVRSVEFDAQKGMLINGERVQINGACIHQTFGAVGSGIPKSLHYYRVELLMSMGVNAIRSHYPLSKSMLEVCDSLGMIVMQETRVPIPSDDGLEQLSWMIESHRNHPSIVIWSLANEEGGIQRSEIGVRTMKRMVAQVHKLDPTRLATAGVNAWGGPVDFGYSQQIDVMGFNYSLEFIDRYHQQHPEQAIIGTEVSNATTTRGVYSINQQESVIALSDGIGGYYLPDAKDEDVVADIQSRYLSTNIIERNSGAYESVKFYGERSYLAGSFIWTGFDYKGETWPSVGSNTSSQFGAIDIAGFPKAIYYYYQSWWRNDPVLHIAQHWNYQGLEGKPITVLIHSNCERVKLYLDGRKVGVLDIGRYGYASCDIPYKAGSLKAVGYRSNRVVAESVISSSGEPYAIVLESCRDSMVANGEDVVVVKAKVVDRDGYFVPVADNKVDFSIVGDAQIVGTANGDPSLCEPDTAHSCTLFNGRAALLIRAGSQSGRVTVIARSKALADGEVSLGQLAVD